MESIQSAIAQMTLEEKAAFCTGATAWSTTPIDRLGIPELYVSDGPHGIRRVADPNSLSNKSLKATCFPTASCLASSWDLNLIHQMGQALAEEAAAMKVDVVLGPGANMKRTPLCGRNFEYFSEDPYLAGEMAASFIDGVQSKGIGTSLKHYAGNNQEHRRMVVSAEIDERALHEIYLRAYEMAVKKSQPWTVMCAYNRVNGVYASESELLLRDILKQDWGFAGLVMSDWGAVHDRVAALRAGLDLEMPGPRPWRVQAVVDAVRSGALSETVLDEAVERILRIVEKAEQTPKGGTYDAAAHHALARKIAAGSMVLLKNNGILPLRNANRIAVVGRAAREPLFQGHGSSHINPNQVDIPIEELQKLAGSAEISYFEGYPSDDSFQPALIEEAAAAARGAEIALLFIGLPDYKESEGYDRPDLDLTGQQVALIQAVTAAQPNTVVILNNGSAVTMSDWIDGAAAVLEAWMMGQAGGGAVADILFGVTNPSGKLAETFPLRLEDTPAYINYPGENDVVRYGEGLFIGYRYYDARQQPVLFPFGHGLSYTTFAYSDLRVSSPVFRDADGLTVSVSITNTGSTAGQEVVQVYVHDRQSSLVRPPKELKGFAKVSLLPGETRTVTVHLDRRAFAFYQPAGHQWITEDGEFDILVGASSADIRAQQTVTLQSTTGIPCSLTRTSTVEDWLNDPHSQALFEPLYQTIMRAARGTFGAEADGSLSNEMVGFILSLPLADVLIFPSVLEDGQVPDEVLDELLRQVYAQPAKS